MDIHSQHSADLSTTKSAPGESAPSSNVVVEAYGEPLAEEFACTQKWVVWEQYENAPGA